MLIKIGKQYLNKSIIVGIDYALHEDKYQIVLYLDHNDNPIWGKQESIKFDTKDEALQFIKDFYVANGYNLNPNWIAIDGCYFDKSQVIAARVMPNYCDKLQKKVYQIALAMKKGACIVPGETPEFEEIEEAYAELKNTLIKIGLYE